MTVTSKRAVAIILSSIAAMLAVVPAASAARSRSYVYRLEVDGFNKNSIRVPAVCTTNSAVIRDTLVSWNSPNTMKMGLATRGEAFNVTLNANTRIRSTGPFSSRVRSVANVCAMNETPLSGTQAGEVNPGVFTWRLTRPARSIAAILTHPATEAVMNTEGE